MDHITLGNHRSSPRWTPCANVTVSVLRTSMANGEDVGNLALDVSVGGARLLVKEPLLPGEQVEIILKAYSLPRPIRATGSVCWCTSVEADDGGWCVGISFDKQLLHREISALFGR